MVIVTTKDKYFHIYYYTINMKKYILTEEQFQKVIDNAIKEEIINEQRGQFLRIPDLAKLAARMGLDEETLHRMFVKVHKNEGDQGLINLFRSVTDLELEDMGYGRYQIK